MVDFRNGNSRLLSFSDMYRVMTGHALLVMSVRYVHVFVLHGSSPRLQARDHASTIFKWLLTSTSWKWVMTNRRSRSTLLEVPVRTLSYHTESLS